MAEIKWKRNSILINIFFLFFGLFRPQSAAISDLEFRLLAMEEERRQLSQDVSMDDRERLKSISQLELRLKALEAERAKLRDAHYDTGWV